jgi:hypothetical protein
MRTLLCLSILAITVAYSTSIGATNINEWGPATNNLQMSISLEGNNNHIKCGEPANLICRYKNLSTNEVFSVYEFTGVVDDTSYSFIITSPAGEHIKPFVKVQEPASGAYHFLRPGQIFEIEFDLGKVYKLDQVGTYTIIAKKSEMLLPGKSQAFEVISNTLEVKVVPNQ